jgi:hypothetical protein
VELSILSQLQYCDGPSRIDCGRPEKSERLYGPPQLCRRTTRCWGVRMTIIAPHHISLERPEATKTMNEVKDMLCSNSLPPCPRLGPSHLFLHVPLCTSLLLTKSSHYEQSKRTAQMFRCARKNCGAYIIRRPNEGNGGVLCDFHQRELFLSIRAMCRHWNKWYTPQGASPVN